jgi:oligosaccharide translocation protein RFT1
MITALAQKAITTILNTALLRFVSADVMGFAANDMELLLSTILFLSREAFRQVADRYSAKTLLRGSTVEEQQKRSQLIAAAIMPVPLGLSFAMLAAIGYSYYHGFAVLSLGTPAGNEALSFYLFCLAAAIDTIVGPLFILSTSSLWFGVRARADVLGTLLQCLTTFALAYMGFGALSFAIGRLALSFTLLAVYFFGFMAEMKKAGVKTSVSAVFMDGPQWKESLSAGIRGFLPRLLGKEAFSLVLAFFGQGLVKHLLTEGDRIILTLGGSREIRGLYSVVSNYGSLAARLLFAPMEEALRRATAQSGLANWLTSARAAPKNGRMPALPTLARSALELFKRYSFFVVWIGLIAISFGPFLSPTFVRLVLGPKWIATTSASSALAIYCCYVLFMALNGVTEAFADGISDPKRLLSANIVLFGAFAVYATAAVGYALPHFGTVGLIVAGCVNMAIRTISSWLYIRSSVAAANKVLPGSTDKLQLRLKDIVPSFPVVLTSILTFICLAGDSTALFARGPWESTDLLPILADRPWSADIASNLLSGIPEVVKGGGLLPRHLFLVVIASLWGALVLALTLVFDSRRALGAFPLFDKLRSRLPFLAKLTRHKAD